MPTRLAFYCFPKKGAFADFVEVARRIRNIASDIRPVVLSTTTANPRALFTTLGLGPSSVSIEMDRVKLIAPRGKRLSHQRISKVAQLNRLAEGGVAVPRWTLIEPQTRLDPKEWGPYVVVKPTRSGRGAYVRVNKTGRVRYQAPETYEADHPGRDGPMIAQRFVFTGRLPVSHRVLTYFGHPVAAIRYDGKPQRELESRYGFREAGGQNIVAPALGCTIGLNADPEILAVAARAHALWPDHPSLGIDLVRDAETGEIFVLEINPGGNSWLFTSEDGAAMQHQFGLDFYRQFDALSVITETSIEVARAWAGRA